MFEEDTVAPANSRLAISFRIPCKSDSWRRVEQMTLHAAHGYAGGHATPDDAVEQVAGNRSIRVDRSLAENVFRRIKIAGLIFLLSVGAKQAYSQAEV